MKIEYEWTGGENEPDHDQVNDPGIRKILQKCNLLTQQLL